MAEFTEYFNVETATPELFNDFIRLMRDRVADGRTGNNVRQLCAQAPHLVTPTRFFDIVFSTATGSVRVRFRRDNLYVVGFMQIQGSQWLEYGITLKPPPHHLIRGSTWLGFTMTYITNGVFIGHQELVQVVNNLGVYTAAQGPLRERGMTMIALTISEAIRFNRVNTYMSLMFDAGAAGDFVPPWIQTLIRIWRHISRAIIVANREGTDFHLDRNDANIVTFQNATREVAMALRVCINRNALVGGIDDCCKDLTDGGDICPAGRPLVEVFQIDIADIYGGVHSGYFYGTITVSDGLTTEYLYNVDKEHAQYIRRHQILVLTGPSRAMWAIGSFTVDISLVNKDTKLPLKGQITWDQSNNMTNVYDKLIYETFDSSGGKVGISYIIFRNAVQANIQVKLMLGEEPTELYKIYGSMTAINSTLQDQSLLFERDSSNTQEVKLFSEIPLQRRVVAIPLAVNLEIRANLQHHNFAEEEIALGSAIYQAKLAGTETHVINGKHGKIQASVTWS